MNNHLRTSKPDGNHTPGPGRNTRPAEVKPQGEAPASRAHAGDGPDTPGPAKCVLSCFTGSTLVLTATAAVLLADVTVGMRVATTQAESVRHEQVLSGTSVDASWRVVSLEFEDPKRPGDRVEIELLRPARWFAEHGVTTVGARVQFAADAVPGAQGWATVVSLRPAPAIDDGPGRVVLMTLRHTDAEMYALKLSETGETLAVTGSHPMWSLDRQDWVPVRSLSVGERLEASITGPAARRAQAELHGESTGGEAFGAEPLMSEDGPVPWTQVRGLQVGARTESARRAVTIAALERIRESREVYDLEVEGDHEFLVGAAGLRAHNCDEVQVIGDSNLFQDRPGALGARSISDNILAEPSLEILVPESVMAEVAARPSQLARIGTARATITVIPDGNLSHLAAQHQPTRAAPSFLSKRFGANDAILAGAGSQRGIPILTTNERLVGQVANRPGAFPDARVLRIGVEVTGPEDLLPLLRGAR